MVVDQTPFTLTKACNACVKAKRRCDLTLPRCSRCLKRRRECIYKNEPLNGPTKQGTKGSAPKLHGYKPSSGLQDDSTSGTLIQFGQSSSLTYSTTDSSEDYPTSSLPDAVTLLPHIDSDWRMIVDQQTCHYLIQQLQNFPTMFVRQGETPFIHRRLYPKQLPGSLQKAHMAYHMTHRSRSSSNSQCLDFTFRELLSTSRSIVTFTDYLSLVQSLVLVQIMTLFSQQWSPIQEAQAEARQAALDRCTRKLWSIAPAEVPSELSPHDAYVFAESVRRTIHVASKLRCCFDFWTKGYFVHTMFQEALPMDRRSELWDCEDIDVSDAVFVSPPQIVSYREFTDLWDAGEILQGGLLETILLVGARGKVAVDEWISQRRLVPV